MADPATHLTVFTPLRAEHAAVRRVLSGSTVLRTGMGMRRASGRLKSFEAFGPGEGPVAVLGVAGGIASHVMPGDVVVASEVRSDAGVFPCPSAPLLAASLRRAGLRVHVGPLATMSAAAPKTTAQERARLAAEGVLAIDMETAAVAAAVASTAADRPFVAVRCISDTADAPLLHPGIVPRGFTALRTLRRIAPILQSWAEAVGAREIVLASPRSFCAGVERAIDTVKAAIDRFGAPVYVRRQIVHNAHVVRDLQERGAIFVTELNEVPDGAQVIFAAHGVTPQVRSEAIERGLRFIDATCPLVAKVHQEVKRQAERGRTVLLLGHADHEEVVGTVGEAPDQVIVVEDVEAALSVRVPEGVELAYAMQTTLAVDEAQQIASALHRRFPDLMAPPSDDICYATTNRQAAVREVADETDLVIVVGSPNSSNSTRLVEVAQRVGAAAVMVDDASEVDLERLRGVRSIGLTAGASAPPNLISEVVQALSGLGPVTVRERRTVDEDVRFTLPREVI